MDFLPALLEIITTPVSVVQEHKILVRRLRRVRLEFQLIKGNMENYQEREVLELGHDIEDFVEGILVYSASDVLREILERPDRMDFLEKKIELLNNRPQKSQQSEPSEGSPSANYTSEEDLVAIDTPKREIMELLSLSPADRQHPGEDQLKVISIFGARGVGKTSLARALHDDPCVSRSFGCVAWIVASGCKDTQDLQTKVLEKVQAGSGDITSTDLPGILANKRYLVFIDDVQGAEMWKDTVNAFPRNGKKSRIIVTTSVRSVAAVGSYGSYVYAMQRLGEAHSEVLFWTRIFGQERKLPRSLVEGSHLIISKCNGLPLALTSAANYLSIKGHNLKHRDCVELGQTLGSYLADDNVVGAFAEMRRRLGQCYDSLPDSAHRTCFLSLSMFPRDHQINSKSLARRLVAEGLVAGDGRKCLEALIDRSIIEPVFVQNNSKFVLRFQVHSIILEFTIRKSLSENFVTLIHEDDHLLTRGSPLNRVRRLAVQSSRKERFNEVTDKSALRSLTMFNSELVDFKSCKMIRVLDLEGCNGLDNRFLEGICELLLLKYLSLRKTDVVMIPPNIEKLQRLETLDIRETQEMNLPIKVIMLPKLAFLFGKFELHDVGGATSELHEFLTNKSELRILAGIVVGQGSECFEGVILEARKLKKVKVWTKDTPALSAAPSSSRPTKRARFWSSSDRNPRPPLSFVSSLREKFTSLDAVSIDADGLCKEFIASLMAPCTISSIKLRGGLDKLPDDATLRGLLNLTKLQLFSTGLSSQELCILQSLPCLEDLKLVEDRDGFWEDNFVVTTDGFESLHELCFEARKHPKLQFQEGALISLTSLHLLCQDSLQMQEASTSSIQHGLGVDGISHLTKLSEVILHQSATTATIQAWKSVGNVHPNRPCIKKRQPVHGTS